MDASPFPATLESRDTGRQPVCRRPTERQKSGSRGSGRSLDRPVQHDDLWQRARSTRRERAGADARATREGIRRRALHRPRVESLVERTHRGCRGALRTRARASAP